MTSLRPVAEKALELAAKAGRATDEGTALWNSGRFKDFAADNIEAMARRLLVLEEVAEAARDSDLASHCTQLCETMTPTRGCRCGGVKLRSELAKLDAAQEKGDAE